MLVLEFLECFIQSKTIWGVVKNIKEGARINMVLIYGSATVRLSQNLAKLASLKFSKKNFCHLSKSLNSALMMLSWSNDHAKQFFQTK